MKKIIGLLIILFVIILSIGCEFKNNQFIDQNTLITKDQLPDDELKYALWSAPSGIFAPQYEKSDYDGMIISLSYEPLIMINPSDEFEGVLAETWEISDDQKTITFHLRNDVKWHDGEEFTANDILFSFKYIADTYYDGDKFNAISAIEGVNAYHEGKSNDISGIEIINKQTIKITTKDIYAPTLEHIGTIKIFPQHIWKDIDVENVYDNHKILTTTIGTGPYTLESVIPNQEVRLVRYNEYWGGKPNIEHITFKIMNSEIAQIKMINGEIDVMQISSMNPNDLQLYEDAGLAIHEVNYNSFQSMTLNTENEVLNNVYVRQALAMAIDRKSIVDTLIFGHGNVANTVYKDTHWAYPDDDEINDYQYSPSKALDYLINKAGFVYEDGTMYYDNKPVTLSLIYPSGNKARELSAPIIQENLSNIGIDVVLSKIEFSDLINYMRDGEYDMALIGNGFKIDPDVSRLFSTDSIDSTNYSRFTNDLLDKLLSDGVKSFDNSVRREIYQEVAKLLNEKLPIVFLYNWSEGRVISDRLKGVECYPYNYFYNVHEWYLEE